MAPELERPKPIVFIVDDEKMICETLSLILRQHGYETLSFFSGEQALANSKGATPSVLVADVMLLGMSGIELAIKFETTYPDCKVLLFSGHFGTAALLNARKKLAMTSPLSRSPFTPTS